MQGKVWIESRKHFAQANIHYKADSRKCMLVVMIDYTHSWLEQMGWRSPNSCIQVFMLFFSWLSWIFMDSCRLLNVSCRQAWNFLFLNFQSSLHSPIQIFLLLFSWLSWIFKGKIRPSNISSTHTWILLFLFNIRKINSPWMYYLHQMTNFIPTS